jgi:urease accessory protein
MRGAAAVNALEPVVIRCTLRDTSNMDRIMEPAYTSRDVSVPPDAVVMQRTRGRAEVRIDTGGRLSNLHQSGSAKAFLPKIYATQSHTNTGVRRPEPEVVFLNTAGGVTGGDKLHFGLHLAAGVRAVATTQTAERAYASLGGAGEITVGMSVDDGGMLSWLPQETILFDGSELNRTTTIALRGSATLLYCETLVLGRAAMGEVVGRLKLRERRIVHRDGVPVLLDPVDLGDDVLLSGRDPALLDGNIAFATVALVSQGAQDALGGVQAVLAGAPCRVAASAWDGKCVVRLMAPDGWPLQQALRSVLRHLRNGDLPRVWQ